MTTPLETQLTTLLRDIVTEFIAHPEDLEIKSRNFHKIISIEWRGHKADTSRMIGEGGETCYHLRQLLRLAADTHGYDVDLARVGDPVKGRPERYPDFKAREEWPRTRLLALLERIGQLATRSGQVEVEEAEIRIDTSAVVLKISRHETLNTETVLKNSLKHLATAMFSPNGRLVKLQVERTLEPEMAQPTSAAGRFAR